MWRDIEQNTEAWLGYRGGRVTGSAISKVMANYGKAFGEPAKRYAVDIATERLKGSPIQGDRYTNAHMDAGHVEEPIARMLYEDMYFTKVTSGGFFDNEKTGCSPDGLVDFDGMIEIKSVVPATHYDMIKRNAHDPSYHWQLMFELKESGRVWVDYISFCEQFYKPKQLLVKRIYAKDCAEDFAKIDTRLAEFEELVEKITLDIKNYQA